MSLVEHVPQKIIGIGAQKQMVENMTVSENVMEVDPFSCKL